MNLAILGSAFAGGSIQIADILLEEDIANDIRIYDDRSDTHGCNVLGIPVVGALDRLLLDQSDGLIDSAIVAIGSINAREKIYTRYAGSGLHFPNIVSSKSTISKFAYIGEGNIILPHVYIGPRVNIANNNYFTTSTSINHDTIIGSHCYFSTSVAVAGRVIIEDRIRFDTGACITADSVVPHDSLIGPGEAFGPRRDR